MQVSAGRVRSAIVLFVWVVHEVMGGRSRVLGKPEVGTCTEGERRAKCVD
jgi:hypothetical protein